MRVLVAGATGAVGRALVPVLRRRGHEVFGTTRSPGNAQDLLAMEAQPVIMDGLNRTEVLETVREVEPEVIVHQMTSLANAPDLKHFDREFALTNRLRTEGADYLIAAARQVGTARLIVQSYTGWPNAREGEAIKSESDPLDATPPREMTRTLESIRELESKVLAVGEMAPVVLRYGAFYGPGTPFSSDGDVVGMVRQRKLPVVGGGGGVWSFVHIDDVAAATALAVEGGPSGLYNIVDDDPAPVSVWLPELARILEAKPPIHVPAWIARFLIGEPGVSMMTRIRGSSNDKAKRLLRWTPVCGSWREGFRRELGGPPAA
ncbi:MAG: NAD(P)-dependent oxidoreductase [Proteobacteria bacterium]|nr:NAD(P)-dependent oxidoreductase [Pseudomonadota bacterium]